MTATNDFGNPSRVRVTLIRSLIGEPPKARGTIRALGLRKIGSQNDLKVTPSLLGMLHRVRHLVRVNPLSNDPATEGDEPHAVPRGQRGITRLDRNDAGVSVSFVAGMTVGAADVALHRAVEDLSPVETTALFWDEGDARIRQYQSTGERPWIKRDRARLALLRIESAEWVVGVQPPLTRASKNVEFHLTATPEGVDEATELLRRVGGEELSSEFAMRLAKKNGASRGG